MFCALSEDLGALAAVGRALKKLEGPALLTTLAGTVDLSDYDGRGKTGRDDFLSPTPF